MHTEQEELSMKKMLLFVLAFSLILFSAAVGETDTAASEYVPERENLYGLYQDLGPHASKIAVTIPDGSELEFGSFFSGGQRQSMEIEIEKEDGTEYEVLFDGDKKIVYAEYETDDGEIYFDGTSWHDENGRAVAGPDLAFMRQYLDYQAIDGEWYFDNTMSLLGLSLRDMYPNLTNKWYQVVPVDLTQDGVFRLPTIASNEYYLGSCIVTIQDGTVTTDYTIPSGCVDPKSSCLMWFTDIGDITPEFLEKPVGSFEFGQPVSIEDDLKGQDIALLFICNRITYRVPITDTYIMPVPFARTNVGVQKLLAEYETLLEKMSRK